MLPVDSCIAMAGRIDGVHHGLELKTCFPHRICINLARRPDRWARMQAQFQQHQIKVDRWNATDGAGLVMPAGWRHAAGAYGCSESHVAAVREASLKRYESLLIFEDDVEFHPELRSRFPRFMGQVPDDWDAIYFGGIHRLEPEAVNTNVVRLVETNSTYAYALRNTIFDAFVAINERTCVPVDETAKLLQKQFKFYCFLPHLAWVTRDYSDILGAEVNHWWLRDGLVTESDVIKSLAAQTCAVLMPPSRRGPLETEVVELTSRAICKLFPTVRAVTQGREASSFGSARLPRNCSLWPVPAEDLADPVRMARTALESFQSAYNYVLLCEADIYVPQWDLRASLLKCLQHDIVSPGEEPVTLTAEETRQALKGSADKVDTRFYLRRASRCPLSGFVIVSRNALVHLMSLKEYDGVGTHAAQVFRSPSRVLRLSTGA